MVKALFLLFFALLGLFWSSRAEAAYVTANDLLKSCQSQQSDALFNCLGYITGVVDYHVMMQSLGTAPTVDFCLPDTMTREKIAVVVMNYLQKSPQLGDFIAAPAVTMALHQSFPCQPIPKKRKKK